MHSLTNFITVLDWTDEACGLKPVVKARYAGHQDIKGESGFDLWTLEESLLEHPVGSTLSDTTIKQAGFALPNRRITP